MTIYADEVAHFIACKENLSTYLPTEIDESDSQSSNLSVNSAVTGVHSLRDICVLSFYVATLWFGHRN